LYLFNLKEVSGLKSNNKELFVEIVDKLSFIVSFVVLFIFNLSFKTSFLFILLSSTLLTLLGSIVKFELLTCLALLKLNSVYSVNLTREEELNLLNLFFLLLKGLKNSLFLIYSVLLLLSFLFTFVFSFVLFILVIILLITISLMEVFSEPNLLLVLKVLVLILFLLSNEIILGLGLSSLSSLSS